MEDTLCWSCKKCYGGCSWSKSFKPVEGWEADRTKVKSKESDYSSYHVKSCPQYQPDEKRITTLAKIAVMVGVSERTLYRWSVEDITEAAKIKGYNIKYNWADKIWYEIRG